MTTVAAGQSATFNLPPGLRLAIFPGGAGYARLGPGQKAGTVFELGTSARAIGPYVVDQIVTITATTGAVTYSFTDPGLSSAGVLVSIAGTPVVGRTLVGVLAAGYLTSGWTWRRIDGSGDNAISGATSQDYTVQAADVGAYVYPVPAGIPYTPPPVLCRAVEALSVAPAPAPPPPPSGAVPTNSVAPTITGTAQSGQTLTGVHGTWTGSPTSYTYQWKRGSTVVGTAQTYAVVDADVGSTLTFSEIASNAAGPAASAAVSAATATVIAASVADTRPRFAVGPLTFNNAALDALLAGATPMDVAGATGGQIGAGGSSNGSKSGSFANQTAGAGTYGWAIVEATASASGVTFTDANGIPADWNGAGLSTPNTGSSPVPAVSSVTRVSGGTTWRFFRQDYPDANPTSSRWTIS